MSMVPTSSVITALKTTAQDDIIIRSNIERIDCSRSEFRLNIWIAWQPDDRSLTFLHAISTYVSDKNFVGIRNTTRQDPDVRAYAYDHFAARIDLWPQSWQVEDPIVITELVGGRRTRIHRMGARIENYIACTALVERIRLMLETVRESSNYEGHRILSERFARFLAHTWQEIRLVVDTL